MTRIVGRPSAADGRAPLLLALEQAQAVLDLCDAEVEVRERLARRDAEIRRQAGRGVSRLLSESARLATPAVEDVRERPAHLVALHAEPARDLVRELVRALRDERERTDAGERERLERASPGFASGLC